MLVWGQSVLGLGMLIGIAWIFSEQRRRMPWRMAIAGVVLQLLLAVLLLSVPAVRGLFLYLNDAVTALQGATEAGTSLVFGYLGGGPLPFNEPHPGSAFILAFQALPLVLLVSALSALLYHWRVLPLIIRAFAWALGKTLRLGGAVSFGTAANVFVGMVEAPLLIRPYLEKASRAEPFILMTAGMATIAGTSFGEYGEGFLRFSYANSVSAIEAAVERIGKLL